MEAATTTTTTHIQTRNLITNEARGKLLQRMSVPLGGPTVENAFEVLRKWNGGISVRENFSAFWK